MKSLFSGALCACLLAAALPMARAAVATESIPPPALGTTLTLETAIRAALAGNPELAGFGFEFRAQQARIDQAGLRPAAEATVGVENILGSGDSRGLTAMEATFALSHVIELGAKREARVDVAQAERGVIDSDRQAAQLDVLAEVSRRFIELAQRQLERELAERTAATAKTRSEAARAPHVEFDRATIALEQARLQQRQADAALETAQVRLAALWGEHSARLDGRPMGRVQADLLSLPEPGDFAVLEQALLRSPDALRFASAARLRDSELRLAESRRQPDLGISGGIRRLQSGDDQALVAAVSIPLFSSRRADSFVAEARANRERVDSEREAALLRARTTLFGLHRQLLQAIADASLLRDSLQPRMEEALRETEYAFMRGRYGYLELVDAQREYLAQQRQRIEASAETHRLRNEIERLTRAPLADNGAGLASLERSPK
jgi:cobalt-zinc-cadmium efflux system outer membrane protein